MRMNLGTLTQFEQSENYVPKYTESQVQVTQTNPRDIDPEERSDVRTIALMNQSYNSLVSLRNSLADSKNNSVKIERVRQKSVIR